MLESNLQQLMQMHGNLSVSDLARLANVPQPTLHHILTGATKNPRKKALDALAQYFSVSVEQLRGNEPLPNIIPDVLKDNLKISTIPLITWDSLKSWPDKAPQGQHKTVLLDKKISNRSFALEVEDDSLSSMFPKNAILIFDYDKEPSDRDFVIVHLIQTDRIAFNRLFTEGKSHYIKQELDDGHAKLIKLDLNVDRLLGTLIEVRIQY